MYRNELWIEQVGDGFIVEDRQSNKKHLKTNLKDVLDFVKEYFKKEE